MGYILQSRDNTAANYPPNMVYCCVPECKSIIWIGAIQVLCNADGGGGVSDFLEKSVTKV